MSYALRIKESATKAMRRLPKRDQARVDRDILALADNPRPPKAIPLTGAGKGFWRIRVGDWRVVYEIDDLKKVVEVQIVAHRREVYRGM